MGDFCIMTFDEDLLHQIRECGERNLDPRSICILLDLSKAESRILMLEFDNIDSDIRRAWEKGKLDKQKEIEDHLEGHVKAGGEGAGDAARSLGYLQRKKMNDALKYELFKV